MKACFKVVLLVLPFMMTSPTAPASESTHLSLSLQIRVGSVPTSSFDLKN